MNYNELKDLTEQGVGLAVASRDEKLRPYLDELVGIKLENKGQKLLAFMDSQESYTALKNFGKFPEIAISISRPCNYYAAQIKGLVKNIRPMTSEENLLSEQWADRYRQELVLINVSPQTVQCLSFKGDTTLEVEVTDFYIQTPGAQAGERIGPK